MKTLNDNIILYDKDCPLCQVYTSGFLKTKMLDTKGRKPFSLITNEEKQFIDIERASNEIALVDIKNKTVLYGVDSLLKIIGHSFPWIEKIGHIKTIKYCLTKSYSFISYNRKVIIPKKLTKKTNLECIPSFNIKYRLFYILFATLITSIITYKYSKSITFLSEILREKASLLIFGLIVFQTLFLINYNKKKVINYIGHLMTVSLMGSFMLTPILLINSFINIPELAILIWLTLTVIIMFTEHYRRIHLLQLPKKLSYTWLIFKILILLFI